MNPVLRVSMRLAALAAAAMVGISAPPASAHDETDPHAHHHMMRNMKMSQVAYNLPDVMLVRDDNRTVSFKDEINDG
ncbi:MAG: SCO family protein, partial [Ralstonia sp.]